MENSVKIDVPISSLICDKCKNDFTDSAKSDVNYSLVSISIGTSELDSPTLLLDVRKIEWRKKEQGWYTADAVFSIPCPNCDDLHILRHRIEAPAVFLADVGRCRTCGGKLLLENEEIEYTDNEESGVLITIHGDLVCNNCVTRSRNETAISSPELVTIMKDATLNLEITTDGIKINEHEFETVPKQGGNISEIYENKVFISYAWGGERKDLVNQIDESLQKRGLKLIRDKRELRYKGSIKEFMERIGHGDCVVIVISDKYLRSPNCMFELIEVAENKQFRNRVFPIVLAEANIYDAKVRVNYLKYWEIKVKELEKEMRSIRLAHQEGIYEELNLYVRIRDRFAEIVYAIKDMNTLTLEMHQHSDFKELYDAIEKQISG
jgi:hypothetical protein